MRTSRFSTKTIHSILNEGSFQGNKVVDVCKRHNISSWTWYQWRKKYQPNAEARKFNGAKKHVDYSEENYRLKLLVADLALTNQALKGKLAGTINGGA